MKNAWQYLNLTRSQRVLTVQFDSGHRVNSLNNALSETTLAIISHTGLAGGIILLGTLPTQEVDIEAVLFGDLLAISIADLVPSRNELNMVGFMPPRRASSAVNP